MFQSVEGIWLAPKMSSLWRGIGGWGSLCYQRTQGSTASKLVGLSDAEPGSFPPIDHLLPKKKGTRASLFLAKNTGHTDLFEVFFIPPRAVMQMILQKTVSSLLLWQVWWAVLRKQAGVNTLWGTLETKLFGSRGCPVGWSISIP